MGDNHEGCPLFMIPSKQRKNLPFRFFIQVARRLIGQDDIRTVDKRTDDGDATLLTSGELGRKRVCLVGQTNFTTLSAKANVLGKLGRESDAKPLREQALNHPTATMLQIHQYGRQLLAAGKKQEALDVFLLNAKRNGDAWPIEVRLARGYLATGDNAKALEHARKAAAQAPDPLNKRNLEAMVKAISEGKPFTN